MLSTSLLFHFAKACDTINSVTSSHTPLALIICLCLYLFKDFQKKPSKQTIPHLLPIDKCSYFVYLGVKEWLSNINYCSFSNNLFQVLEELSMMPHKHLCHSMWVKGSTLLAQGQIQGQRLPFMSKALST